MSEFALKPFYSLSFRSEVHGVQTHTITDQEEAANRFANLRGHLDIREASLYYCVNGVYELVEFIRALP